VLDKPNEAMEVLRKSPDQVLLEASRWPDLAEFRRDSRFQDLMASRKPK